MKRFASHYVALPGNMFLKQCVVEMEEGVVIRLFPLTEEIESVEWLPGVIALLPEHPKLTTLLPETPMQNPSALKLSLETGDEGMGNSGESSKALEAENNRKSSKACICAEIPTDFAGYLSELRLSAQLLYPFDFTLMQPVAGTQRRQLR